MGLGRLFDRLMLHEPRYSSIPLIESGLVSFGSEAADVILAHFDAQGIGRIDLVQFQTALRVLKKTAEPRHQDQVLKVLIRRDVGFDQTDRTKKCLALEILRRIGNEELMLPLIDFQLNIEGLVYLG